jgi:hypothetical protein
MGKYRFYWKRFFFNLLVYAMFLVGFNILFSEIGPRAALATALIGLSALLVGYYGKQLGGRNFKYEIEPDEEPEKE